MKPFTNIQPCGCFKKLQTFTWAYLWWSLVFITMEVSYFHPATFINPFSSGILWKTANEKPRETPTLNNYISKTGANLESKLTFFESSFKLLQNSFHFYKLCSCSRWLHPLRLPLLLSAADCVLKVKKGTTLHVFSSKLCEVFKRSFFLGFLAKKE